MQYNYTKCVKIYYFCINGGYAKNTQKRYYIESLANESITGHTVYFLLQDEEIVYIGYSKNKYNRVETHIGEGRKIFNRVYFITNIENRKIGEDIEREYIKRHSPKYNKTHNPEPTADCYPFSPKPPTTNKRYKFVPKENPAWSDSQIRLTEYNYPIKEPEPIPEYIPPVIKPNTKRDSIQEKTLIPINGHSMHKNTYVRNGDTFYVKIGNDCYKTKETEIFINGRKHELNKRIGNIE